MNSIRYSLLWKEWREHRWIMAILAATLVAVPLLFSLRSADNYFGALSTSLLTIPIVAMFLGMNIAAREQSAGTIRFLQALPTSGTKPAAAKLFWSAMTIAAPVALAVAAAAGWAALNYDRTIQLAIDWDTQTFGSIWKLENWYAARFVGATIAGVSLLVWMSAFGVNRSDEVRAGAIGFLGILCVWVALALVAYPVESAGPQAQMPHWLGLLVAMAPGGAIFAPAETADFGRLAYWPFAIAAMLSHAALAAWFLARFSRIAAARIQTVESAQPQNERHWLAPPRRSPLTAMLWKQSRESAPLAALGAGAIVAMSLLVQWIVRQQEGPKPPENFAELVYGIWMLVGIGVSIVAGVGVFLEDLRPGIHQFWRSRPIDVDRWFVVKFFAGLVVTVLSLAAGALVLWAAVLLLHGSHAVFDRLSPRDAATMIGAGLLAQFGLFSAAVLAMTLIRQPVYAVVTAIAAAWATMVGSIVAVEWLVESRDRQGPVIMAITAMLVLLAVGIAWLAVRKDWGWKR